jgi:hypothetical protein
MPRRKRTPAAWAKLSTKAVASEMAPKPSEMPGSHHPGPKYLQAMLEGISKTMYEM